MNAEWLKCSILKETTTILLKSRHFAKLQCDKETKIHIIQDEEATHKYPDSPIINLLSFTREISAWFDHDEDDDGSTGSG
jgi:hypothetical protein